MDLDPGWLAVALEAIKVIEKKLRFSKKREIRLANLESKVDQLIERSTKAEELRVGRNEILSLVIEGIRRNDFVIICDSDSDISNSSNDVSPYVKGLPITTNDSEKELLDNNEKILKHSIFDGAEEEIREKRLK